MNENEELLAGIQRVNEEMDAIVSAWNRVQLKAMDAAADERAKIVAWLRNNNDFYAQSWVRDIEAGEHLK